MAGTFNELSAFVPQRALRKAGTNVNGAERVLSVLGGGALVAWGLSRRNASGLAVAAVGGVLVKRGATGRSRLYRALGLTTLEDTPALEPGAARPRRGLTARGAVRRVERSVTVLRPREEVYSLLRTPERLLGLLDGLTSVQSNEGRVRWIGAEGAAWEAEVADDRENEQIAWRAVDRGELIRSVLIRLVPAPGNQGTEVHVALEHGLVGGGLGLGLAKLFDMDPDQRVRVALRRLKQLLEAGEIPTVEGQPSCCRD